MIFKTGGRWDGSGVVDCARLNENDKIKLIRREAARSVTVHSEVRNDLIYVLISCIFVLM